MLIPEETRVELSKRAYEMAFEELSKRAYCTRYDRYGRCIATSTWYTWQRWLVLGLILFLIPLLFICASCATARRRKKRGLAPYYGTGWAAYGAPPAYDVGNSQNQHNNNNIHTGQQYTGQTGYATQETYASHGGHYAPPAGPPPGTTNHEMGGYGNQQQQYYPPPANPPPAHVSKY